MPLKKGERYRCPEPTCGCEIEVTKGAPKSCQGTEQPSCCCGRTMEKIDS